MPDAFPETVSRRRAAGQPRRRALAARGDRGHPGADRPADPGRGGRHRQQGRERRPARAGLRRRAAGLRCASTLPRRRRARPRAAADQRPPDCRVGLAAARRRQPRAGRPGRAARRRRRAPGGRHPRPQAARVAVAAAGCSSSASPSPAPAGGRPGWSAASTTRASTTRCARCSRSTPPACWSAARVLEELGGFDEQLPIFGNDIDFGWRAAAAGHTHDGGAVRRWSSTPRRPTAASAGRR